MIAVGVFVLAVVVLVVGAEVVRLLGGIAASVDRIAAPPVPAETIEPSDG